MAYPKTGIIFLCTYVHLRITNYQWIWIVLSVAWVGFILIGSEI